MVRYIRAIPRTKTIMVVTDFLRAVSFLISGKRSVAAMYMNPPAANGRRALAMSVA